MSPHRHCPLDGVHCTRAQVENCHVPRQREHQEPGICVWRVEEDNLPQPKEITYAYTGVVRSASGEINYAQSFRESSVVFAKYLDSDDENDTQFDIIEQMRQRLGNDYPTAKSGIVFVPLPSSGRSLCDGHSAVRGAIR